jgi:hypothetical protein
MFYYMVLYVNAFHNNSTYLYITTYLSSLCGLGRRRCLIYSWPFLTGVHCCARSSSWLSESSYRPASWFSQQIPQKPHSIYRILQKRKYAHTVCQIIIRIGLPRHTMLRELLFRRISRDIFENLARIYGCSHTFRTTELASS